MKTLKHYAHPGPASFPRHIAVKAQCADYFYAQLTGQVDVFAFARTVVARLDARAALMLFSHVPLSQAAFHVCEDDPVHGRILRYSQAVAVKQPCELVAANMTVGQSGGQTLLHCHGAIRKPCGAVVGGHLAEGQCITRLGASTVRVLCLALEGVSLAPQQDEETGFPLLNPSLSPSLKHTAHKELA
jgi:hypothetical protein